MVFGRRSPVAHGVVLNARPHLLVAELLLQAHVGSRVEGAVDARRPQLCGQAARQPLLVRVLRLVHAQVRPHAAQGGEEGVQRVRLRSLAGGGSRQARAGACWVGGAAAVRASACSIRRAARVRTHRPACEDIGLEPGRRMVCCSLTHAWGCSLEHMGLQQPRIHKVEGCRLASPH